MNGEAIRHSGHRHRCEGLRRLHRSLARWLHRDARQLQGALQGAPAARSTLQEALAAAYRMIDAKSRSEFDGTKSGRRSCGQTRQVSARAALSRRLGRENREGNAEFPGGIGGGIAGNAGECGGMRGPKVWDRVPKFKIFSDMLS